jgi:hypothetical protein
VCGGAFVRMIKIMLRPAAPTASALACRDDRDTPLVSRADGAT